VIGGLVTPRRIVEAVAAGEIDVGPVDGYAFDLLRRHEPALAAQVRPIAATEPTPIPPFVATADLDHHVASALQSAFLAVSDAAELAAERDALLLRGFAIPDASAYDGFSRYQEAADRFAGVW
jgi:ABC-type phosphate/phosphonate transport system substrate-binding protein